MHLSRRDFLRAGAQGALVLGLARLELACGPSERSSDRQTSRRVAPRPAREPETYRSWEDVYRQAWTWDRVVKVTHTRANCIAACSWNAFVKDGIVWREEQNAIYEPSHPSVPDMNPRGCQKGACFSQLMVEPSRVKYPLRRVGERGSGRWERVSWEAALREIADRLLDVALRDGPDCVVYDHGTTNIDFGTGTGAELRFFQLFGATIMDSWAGVGDLPMGAIQTWGHFNADGSSDDWFRSDYYVIWLANPVYTRIPDVHFVWEARYRGATVVSVAPDYNASSIHADLWLAPRVGTDAALALSLAQVIVSEKLYDADYVREQTDLPFLVREDTGRYLRESDLERGGREEVFYFWDERTQKLAEAPGSQGHPKQTLALGGVRPALHGSFVVRLADGGTARVTPLFERLARHLETFTPEKTREVTGVSSSLVRKVARDFARARRAMIFASWGSCKHYHSDLVQRALCLLVALTGNQGKSGGGVRPGAWYSIDGLSRLAGEISVPFYVRLWARFFRPKVRDLEALLDRVTRERAFTATLPFLYVHGGMKELVDRPDFHDSSLPRPFVEYVREATEKGWMPVSPPPDRPPRVYFFTGANPLRRWPVPQVVRRHLWPKLELVVSLNFRMSSTGLEADFVLPAAGYYEKIGIKYPQSLVPYIVFGDKAVEPLGESKSEWEVMTLFARAVQERARERGIVSFVDPRGIPRDYANFYEDFTMERRFDETKEEKAMDWLLRRSPAVGKTRWSEARRTGAVRVRAFGHYGPHNAICSDYEEGNTVYPHRRFVEKKEPWPTLTGRQQFLLEHPWYVEAGEELPTYKEPPKAGGDYPLRLTGGHTRWSIHAIWRDQRHMLRLQRGEPVLFVNPEDARARGIGDHALVRVRNDVDSFLVRAKLSPAVQPGQVVLYHAWENFQFADWQQGQAVVPSPWKALHLASGYGHLRYRMYGAAPSHTPRGTTVEVEAVT